MTRQAGPRPPVSFVPLIIAAAFLTVTVIAIVANRRQAGDVALMGFGVLVVLGTAVYYVLTGARIRAEERRVAGEERRRRVHEEEVVREQAEGFQARREARWEAFSREEPDGGWIAGVHRVPRAPYEPFAEQVLYGLPASAAELDRVTLMGEAIGTAREYNERAGL